MDFGDITPFTGPPPAFSPDGRYVAAAQEFRLVIRDTDTLTVLAIFSCLDRIDSISWSPNSDHILCALLKRATVQVFSVSNPEFTCSISEGQAGLVSARWSPNGQHLLLFADFQIRLSVWSLLDQACVNIDGPKHPDAGVAFSSDGKRMALLGRSDCKDRLTIYDTTLWKQLSQFNLATQDAIDISWSPDCSVIAAWESPAYSHAISIYAVDGGSSQDDDNNNHLISSFSAYKDALGIKHVTWSPSGQLLSVGSYDPEVRLLNCVTWNELCQLSHPTTVTGPPSLTIFHEVDEQQSDDHEQQQREALSQVNHNNNNPTTTTTTTTAVPQPVLLGPKMDKPGSRRGSPIKSPSKSTLGNSTTSRLSSSSGPPSRSTSPTKCGPSSSPTRRPLYPGGGGSASSSPTKTRVPPSSSMTMMMDDENGGGDGMFIRTKYAIASIPARISSVRPPMDKPNPKLGVSWSEWSHDGSYFATRVDHMPAAVWVWDTARLEPTALLVQDRAVKSVAWDPLSSRLAVVTGSGKVYFWTPSGASCVHIPLKGFRPHSLTWHPDGTSFMLSGKDSFTCAYV
jgi:WD40 repeat protein